MKTWIAKGEEIEKKWWLVDATDKKVGRIATQIANILRGKNKPTFTPNTDVGDFVIVINTDKIQFSGNKWDEKKYYTRSRYFGSLKETSALEMREKDSTHIVQEAVFGMLPQNKLSEQIITKLKTYPAAEHPHAAQKPEALTLN